MYGVLGSDEPRQLILTEMTGVTRSRMDSALRGMAEIASNPRVRDVRALSTGFLSTESERGHGIRRKRMLGTSEKGETSTPKTPEDLAREADNILSLEIEKFKFQPSNMLLSSQASNDDGGENLLDILEKTTGKTHAANRYWKHAGGAHCHNSQSAVWLATVPRSGNSWLRNLLEEASGIATEAVFVGEPCFTPAKETSCKCGQSGDCTHVHLHHGADKYVIKTHFPFLGPNVNLLELNKPIEKAVLTVRNPLDNYFAWNQFQDTHKGYKRRYKGASVSRLLDTSSIDTIDVNDFKVFLKKWMSHIKFWFTTGNGCMNTTMARYEDLITSQRDILSHLTDAIGYPAADITRAVHASPPMNQSELSARNVFYNSNLLSKFRSSKAADMLRSEASSLLDHMGYASLIRPV